MSNYTNALDAAANGQSKSRNIALYSISEGTYGCGWLDGNSIFSIWSETEFMLCRLYGAQDATNSCFQNNTEGYLR